ncbi:tRNA pseudouridine(38-40) synthase TruA [Sellimonas caecigallum]|uniref:tRNA pseudouridine synthase A n=1 Tax=Sellimonas caecigallum TaxID=2592333 RepID=A0ABS7L7W2_9FIRM|nr:tRNA pseudouridine(38-40) synthase TruA [Sellimonas caecigallum]MBY0759160.1 tRNA pseudouridine(38-40) synthase TruA [Sellimonas caecigallum]
MRTYKLTIAYDGTRYQGWQRQAGVSNTIQHVVEKAICSVTGYEVKIQGSGRTDGGVHAFGQTASLRLSGKVEIPEFQNKLNTLLPEDIRILDMELVPNTFHGRRSAKGKCYVYYVDTREKQNVFTRKYTCHYPEKLNVGEMRAAASHLCGRHDFTSFTDRKDEISCTRRIDEIRIEEEKDKIILSFRGNGFMYHMVRILSGTLLEVGSGKKRASDVDGILKAKDRQKAGFLAPAQGLFLKEVYYLDNRKEEEGQ